MPSKKKPSSTSSKTMKKMSQAEPGGNTSAPASAKPDAQIPKYQLYLWCFTLDASKFNPSQLSQKIQGFAKTWTFQLEKGEVEGYLHYQGVMSLKTKEYFHTVKNLLDSTVHLEPCRSWQAALEYCSKKETRVAGPWTETRLPLNIITKLLPWQTELETILLGKPDDRKIIWYYDNVGGSGKTQFSKYLAINHNASILANAKTRDIAFAIKNCPTIVAFNLTRSQETSFNYQVLEQIKDGLIFSSKYESTTLVFDTPHVVVFTNFLPNINALSKDRWDIRILEKTDDVWTAKEFDYKN